MTEKSCTACKQVKPVEEFGTHKSTKDGLQFQCKSCRKIGNANYYVTTKQEQNPKRYARRHKAIAECQRIVWEYLRDHSCVDCGESDIVVLQFDHVRGEKKYDVSYMVGCGLTKGLVEEIDKCMVRCANCHTRKTAKDFGWLKALQS